MSLNQRDMQFVTLRVPRKHHGQNRGKLYKNRCDEMKKF